MKKFKILVIMIGILNLIESLSLYFKGYSVLFQHQLYFEPTNFIQLFRSVCVYFFICNILYIISSIHQMKKIFILSYCLIIIPVVLFSILSYFFLDIYKIFLLCIEIFIPLAYIKFGMINRPH